MKKKFRVGGIWPGPPTYPPHRVPQPLCILQIKQKRHCCLYTIPLSFFLLENITGNPPIVQGFDTTNLFTEKKSSLPSFLSFVPGCHHAWLSLSQHCWNVRQFLGGRWTLGRHGISWRRSFDWYCNSFKVSITKWFHEKKVKTYFFLWNIGRKKGVCSLFPTSKACEKIRKLRVTTFFRVCFFISHTKLNSKYLSRIFLKLKGNLF